MAKRQLDFYVKALFPERYHICGVNLRPFCLAHYFLMQRFESAFLNEHTQIATDQLPKELFLAIAICSRTDVGFLEFIEDAVELERWSKEWSDAMVTLVTNNKEYSFLEDVYRFQEYMQDGIVVPYFWDLMGGDIDTEKSGAHWTQSVLFILTSKLGYSVTEALNIPLARAIAEHFKYLESEGAITLMQDWQIDLATDNKETANGQGKN